MNYEQYEPFTCHHCDAEFFTGVSGAVPHFLPIGCDDTAVCTVCLIEYYPALVESMLPQPPEFCEVAA